MYDSALVSLYKQIENTIFYGAAGLGRSIVIDRAQDLSAKSRQRWIALARSIEVPLEIVVFKMEDAKIHAKRRFDHDSRGESLVYWERVANIHAARYDKPSLNEGISKIIYLES